MAGYNRPTGGWTYEFEGLNTTDAPDALAPTQYPYARNIRGLADRSVRTRPGYTLFSTTPHITSSCPTQPATVGTGYTFTLTATGGIPPYTWVICSGALPTGLTLSSGGVISGTPSVSGLFSFIILVTDAAGGTDVLNCSLYVCPTAGTNTDWIGCMSGSFTNSSDWFIAGGGITISGNVAAQSGVANVSMAYKTANTCGVSLNQEVYLVYGFRTTPFSGNRGYFEIGPGVRMNGTNNANLSGYFFTAQIFGGTLSTGCGYENGVCVLRIFKSNFGALSILQTTTIPGSDLAAGIPMDIQCTNESGSARIKGILAGTQLLNVLDTSSVLPSGGMGLASLDSCGGVTPNITFTFIKGQLL